MGKKITKNHNFLLIIYKKNYIIVYMDIHETFFMFHGLHTIYHFLYENENLDRGAVPGGEDC